MGMYKIDAHYLGLNCSQPSHSYVSRVSLCELSHGSDLCQNYPNDYYDYSRKFHCKNATSLADAFGQFVPTASVSWKLRLILRAKSDQ